MSATLFKHGAFSVRGATQIDDSPIILVYMMEDGKKLIDTARFDLGKMIFIDPPFGPINISDFSKLMDSIRKINRK